MSARVTVIVRTRGRPEFLRRALGDIAAQDYRDYEVVVVDDGDERDQVASVVESASATNVRVVTTTEPRGRCRAANAGIRAAEGEFVVLHDDDDRWHPSFLSRTVERLDARPEEAGVMTSTAIVYEEQEGAGWREVDRVPFWDGMSRISLTELLEINRAVPISFLYRRSLHDEVGWYDESLDAVEDWDFYLRVVPAFPVGFLDGEPLAYWVQRPNARGADANSTLGLLHEHERDDLVVRDRELAAWVRQNGTGLPLYLAHLEKQIVERVTARVREAVVEDVRRVVAEDVRRVVAEELEARQPVGRRWRALRRRLGR